MLNLTTIRPIPGRPACPLPKDKVTKVPGNPGTKPNWPPPAGCTRNGEGCIPITKDPGFGRPTWPKLEDLRPGGPFLMQEPFQLK